MTQKFTTPCFIRKNTLELRKKLEELGYKPSMVMPDNERLCIATAVNREYAKYTNIIKEMFDSDNPHETWNCAGRIDCGTDERLFLAIAALRDDSDINQWFVRDKKILQFEHLLKGWVLCTMNSAIEFFNDIYYTDNYHKATVEELIEHFRNEL